MKISVTDLSPCRRSLSVEVPPSMVDAEYEKAYKTYSKRISIAGFRQGKVPKHIVAQRFGKEIEQDVVESLIRTCSVSAIKEKGLQPLHSPVLKDYKFDRGSGLSFVAEFEVKPDLDPAGYKEIKVERRAVVVTEDDVDKALQDIRERRARFDGVEDRGVQQEDFVLAEVKGEFPDSGDEPISQPEAFFAVGSNGPHPEFTDELSGMRPAEEKTFGINYPEDHPSELLKGKRVVFNVKLKEIKTRHLPALDDEFAKDLGAGTTLDELKARVRKDLDEAARGHERSEARRKALDMLVEANAGVAVPESMVDDQIEGYVEDLMHRLRAQGIDPETAGVDLERVRSEQREPAKKSVTAVLLLDAIASRESLEVSDREVDEALEREAARMKQPAEALRARWSKEGRLEALKRHLLREKVLDLILGASNI